jgi:hypothetical protein
MHGPIQSPETVPLNTSAETIAETLAYPSTRILSNDRLSLVGWLFNFEMSSSSFCSNKLQMVYNKIVVGLIYISLLMYFLTYVDCRLSLLVSFVDC